MAKTSPPPSLLAAPSIRSSLPPRLSLWLLLGLLAARACNGDWRIYRGGYAGVLLQATRCIHANVLCT